MSRQQAQTGFDVILPAGGKIEGEFAKATGITHKALLSWKDRTFLGIAIETFRSVPGVQRVVVIGDGEVDAEARRREVEGVLSEGKSGPENIFRGLEIGRAHV